MSVPNGSPSAFTPALVNEQLFFDQILRRLFSNDPYDVLTELLQNAQRAGASQISFRFQEAGRCEIVDNGHGLLNGEASLYDLLCVGASRYDDPQVATFQSPMGVGFYALLALQGIERVTLESGTITLEIEPARWFQDQAYRAAWHTRILKHPRASGFRLVVEGSEEVLSRWRTLLRQEGSTPHRLWPAQGYAGILEVLVDGVPVATELPDWVTLPKAQIKGQYLGHELRLQLGNVGPNGGIAVLWFGQLILTPAGVPWSAFLRVGPLGTSPVNPQAPIRKGLIKDQALEALCQWIEDQIFAYVLQRPDPPSAGLVAFLHRINASRALQECPYGLLRAWQPFSTDDLTTVHDLTRPTKRMPKQVIRRAEADRYRLLDSTVMVVLPKKQAPAWCDVTVEHPSFPEGHAAYSYDFGLPSLLAASGIEAYRAYEGLEATKRFWWKPGPTVDGFYTSDPGEWGIGTAEEPPTTWEPFKQGSDLFVHGGTNSWDVEDVEWVIATPDIVRFLQTYARAGWEPDDTEVNEADERSFDRSVEILIQRNYLKDTLLITTDIGDLRVEVLRVMEQTPAPLVRVEVDYLEQGQVQTRTTRLIARFEDGTERVLRLY